MHITKIALAPSAAYDDLAEEEMKSKKPATLYPLKVPRSLPGASFVFDFGGITGGDKEPLL